MDLTVSQLDLGGSSANVRLRSADYDAVGQTFIAASTCSIVSAKMRFRKAGSPTGLLTLKLYSVDGSHTPNTLLDISSEVDVSTLTTDAIPAYIELSGFSGYTVTQGVEYFICAAYSDGAGENMVRVNTITEPTPYSWGRNFGTSNWVDLSPHLIEHFVYGYHGNVIAAFPTSRRDLL